LEIVSSSAEFENIPIRRYEESMLRRIYDRLPVKIEKVDYEAPHFKTFVLLQAHFSRIHLPPDLHSDLTHILEKVLTLLSAAVDVMSSNAWLSALGAMDLSQMCVQALWENDSPLKQIPHFEPQLIKKCIDAGVESVYDIIDLEDDKRTELLQMTNQQLKDVAMFVNSYPTIELSYEIVKAEYQAGVPIVIRAFLSRDVDEEDDAESNESVVAPLYPGTKMAHWWLVIGEPSTRQLLAIKRITVKKSVTVSLDFTLPKGSHALKLYLICDSYMGADHDIQMETLLVAEGEDSDSDGDMDSGDETG